MPIDRDRPVAPNAVQRRVALRRKLQGALLFVPSIDPSKGEQDPAGDRIEELLLSACYQDLDYLVPRDTPEQLQKVADLRTAALKASKLDDVVERIAARAQRLAHMLAIGATAGFIRMAGYDESLRAVVRELISRIPEGENDSYTAEGERP